MSLKNKDNLTSKMIGIAIISLLFITSLIFRISDFKNGEGITNIEATYHSLLVVKSMSERPLHEYFFLPIVTLGGTANENVPWGAAISNLQGEYIYTSFPSLGFVAPLLFIKALQLSYSINSLFAFNLAIELLSTLIFYFALCKLFSEKSKSIYISAALSCTAILLSRESLASYGLLYWPQSLSQLFIACFLFGIIVRLKGISHSGLVIIWFSCFMLSLTEWTGLMLGGMSFLYFIASKKNRDIRLAFTIFSSVTAAISLYLLQLYLTVDLYGFFSASLSRFLVRSGGNASFIDLIKGYVNSFSLFLLVIPLAAFLKVTTKIKMDRAFGATILLTIFMLSENVLLAQHATSYTFDRLKLSFLLAILACYIMTLGGKKIKTIVILSLTLSCILSINDYKHDVKQFARWKEIKNKNNYFANELLKTPGFECAKIFDSNRVRAYLNLLTNRSVWERLPDEKEIKNQGNGECPVIIINGETPFKDLQEISSIDVFRNGLKVKTIKP